MKRRLLLQASMAIAAGAGWPLARGDVGFDALDDLWNDGARQRPLPVRLYMPRLASAAQPVPLVVFSHGIGGSRLGYGYLGRHWASHGVASLHLQHVGSDNALWRGNVFSLVNRLQSAAQEAEALARVADLRFALDHVLGSELGERLDATRIVAAGHSYGANTTLLACGAQVKREGRVIDLRNPRITAALIISAPPFYGETSPEAILAPVRVPTLHVSSAEDVIRVPGYYSGVDDRLRVFEATGSQQKWLALFRHGTHSGFVGRAGDANPVVVATKQLALAFVQQVVQGQGGAVAAWHARHGDLVERFVAPA